MALAPWQDEVLLPAPGFSDAAPRYNIISAEGTVAMQNVKIVLQNIVDVMGTQVNAENVNAIIEAINSAATSIANIISGAQKVGVAGYADSAGSAGTATSATSAVNANYANSAGAVAWGNVSGKPSTYAPSAHSQSAGTITAGTFPEQVVAANSAINKGVIRNIYAGTGDMVVGSTGLTTGMIYLMYE